MSSSRNKVSILPLAFHLFIALLAAIPILAIANTAIGDNLIALSIAIVLLIASAAKNESVTASGLLKRLSIAIALPVAWMLVQIVPIPFTSMENSIWPIAFAALYEPSLLGHIGIDPGSTLRCLMEYLTILALVMIAVVHTQNRQKAETALFVLCIVAAVMAAEALLSKQGSPDEMVTATTYIAISAAGVPMNVGALVLLIERQLTRREREPSPFGPMLLKFCVCLTSIAICTIALLAKASGDAAIGSAAGVVVILLIVSIRRFSVRSWSLVILFAIVACLALGGALMRFQKNASGTMLAFAASEGSAPLAASVTAMPDFKWLGSGVGTFATVAQIYREYGTEPILEPPSTMTAVALEWGRPALVILLGIAAQLFIFVFSGALRRGRDFSFSAVAAATLTVACYEGFSDASLTHFPVQLIFASILGLGIAQSAGRTSGL